MKNAKHIVKTVLFCGTLAVFSAVSVFSPKEKGSFYENRRLAVFPVPSVETVLDGTFFSNVETYISDHFAYRVPLLRRTSARSLRCTIRSSATRLSQAIRCCPITASRAPIMTMKICRPYWMRSRR